MVTLVLRAGHRLRRASSSSACGCCGELRQVADRLGLQDDAGLARRIGHLVAAFDALWALTKRNVSEAARTGVPGIGGSVFKLSFSEHSQALGDLAMEVLDRAALCGDPLIGSDGTPLGNDEQLARLVQGHLARPSPPAPRRCSATSWASASSACPRSR